MGTVILYALVSLLVGISIAAGIIMLATRIAAGFTPKFLLAAATVVVAWIATFIASWLMHMIVGAGALSSLIALVVLLLVSAAIINAMLKRPDGGQMGFGKAFLAALLYVIIFIVLGVILFFIFGAGMMGMVMGGAAAMH
ncbi:MAG: hypothetical protein WBV39_11370 [Rudaea sp.]